MREWLFIGLVLFTVPLVAKRPLYGIACYLGANVVRPEMLFWGGGRGSFVFKLYLVLVLLATFTGGYLSRAGRVLNREFLLMVWLILAVLVSCVFAQYPVYRGGYYVLELVKAVGVCALLYLLVSEFAQVRLIQNVLLGCFAFLGAWGIDQSLRGNERLEGLGGNAWGDSNDLAAVFVLFLPVAFARYFTADSRKERWQGAAVIAIMVILIVCTKSRGGLLGLIACCLAYGFYSRNMKKIVVAVLLMAVVVAPFATQKYFERLENMKSEENLDGSARSRLVLWQLGLKVFSDNPLLGTGFLTYPYAKFQYQDDFYDLEPQFHAYIFRTTDMKVTHNTYIQMLSDCGLFGAVPYLLLVGGGIAAGLRGRRLLRSRPDRRREITWVCGLSAGVTGFAVCVVTINSVLIPFLYFQLAFIGIVSRMLAAAPDGGALPELVPGTAAAAAPVGERKLAEGTC